MQNLNCTLNYEFFVIKWYGIELHLVLKADLAQHFMKECCTHNVQYDLNNDEIQDLPKILLH